MNVIWFINVFRQRFQLFHPLRFMPSYARRNGNVSFMAIFRICISYIFVFVDKLMNVTKLTIWIRTLLTHYLWLHRSMIDWLTNSVRVLIFTTWYAELFTVIRLLNIFINYPSSYIMFLFTWLTLTAVIVPVHVFVRDRILCCRFHPYVHHKQ